ncbi:MAG: high-affinity choline transporter BetT, partial [Actinomycetota bacterium]|nr:high-affinity choline transporter BetT [Actinomycetota bacterium]
RRYSLPARFSGRSTSPDGDRAIELTWRQRLSRSMSFPSYEKTTEFLSEIALPALNEVGEEMREHGVDVEVRDGTNEADQYYVELVADLDDESPFQYKVEPREARMPVYGDSSMREGDFYYRLDVHLLDGGQGYDVMGYTYSQLIDDVLDQYEQHVEFVRLNTKATR